VSASITVDGASRMSATLGHAADDVGQLDAADARASAIIAAAARARAPRRTGRLAGSIAAAPGEGAGRVVVGAEYAAYVEYGVPVRHVPARPFLAEAAEVSGPVAIDAYRDEVQRVVAQVEGV
jgi:phage gpG-like protein